jgi:hypothetical protein
VSSWVDLHALWQILVFGLLAGAGLPALFAVGLRAVSLPGNRVRPAPAGADADSDRVVGGSAAGIAVGVLCFAVVLAAIGWGIWEIWKAGHA